MKKSVIIGIVLLLISFSIVALYYNKSKTVMTNVQMSEPTMETTPTPTCTPRSAPTHTPEPTHTPTPIPTSVPTPTDIPITAPVIVLSEGDTLTITADFFFTDPGFSAFDYRGNDLSDRVISEGEVVPYLVGTYELSYTVIDDLEQVTHAKRVVNVVPAELPDVVVPPEKTVYLTFDDGPSGYTEMLLDVLKKYDAKATFFVVGSKSRKDLIARAYQEGHAIGVHCFYHEYEKIYFDEQAYFTDFLKAQEVIKEQTGSYTRIFRFPGGSANTVSYKNKGLMTRLTKIMEDMGYRYFDWSVSANDAVSPPNYTELDIQRRIIGGISNHPQYSIVLQHDIYYISVHAVEEVLRWGVENGYTFAALDLSSPILHSKVQN